MTEEQAELFEARHKQERLPVGAPGAGDPARAEGASLDEPQEFTGASSYEVRDELEELIRADLLGPWDGETEQFRPRAMGPRERYLVGMLGPKDALPSGADPAEGPATGPDDEVPDTESVVGGDASEGELPDVPTPQTLGRMWASSMGLSFAVPGDVDALAVTAAWGRYGKVQIETEEGATRRVWTREPVRYDEEVRLDGHPSYRIPLTGSDPGEPGVVLAVSVRPQGTGERVVELTLVNAQREPASNADTAWLFQTALTVTALDGDAPVFVPVDDPADGTAAPGDDPEERHLRVLYRDQRRYAAGRNVAVHADVRDGERRARGLATTWLPTYEVPSTVAPSAAPYLSGVELSMDALADADPEALRAGLAPLADGYRAWLDERAAEIAELPESLRDTAEAAVFEARRAAERIRAGVDLLTGRAVDATAEERERAVAAFRFANRAMALQRRHTTIGALRDERGLTYEEAAAEVAGRGAGIASWRPFQLAFILLNLPSLTDPAHPERAADRSAVVDLLFFPTGGGKTEAYLGLMAYTFAIRRLQGTVGSGEDARSGAGGTAALMRYTLRLLTAQQFQRAATLVCAAEVLRRRAEESGDTRWGSEPFRIGLWVGGGVSPNWFEEAKEKVAEAKERGDDRHANVLQTLACPWCGEKLRAYRDMQTDEAARRVLLRCPNAEGASACPFSQTASREGLPILTVDEEIYRYAPSLVIATVDKLAQLPWRGYAGILFGRVRQWCPRHGYRHDDLDRRTGCGGRHTKKGALPAVASQPVTRLRPPDLIIQDELHLISGALGTTVGLFEAAVDELCTWNPPDRPRGGANAGAGDGSGTDAPYGTDAASGTGSPAGPKIVASTATTKRAREQVLGVFGRDLAVFPPQVVDVGQTFFSEQVPVTRENPGRRYLGVCAHGVRLKSAEIRLAEILLLAGQTLVDRHGEAADPYMTLVDYFNATRELAGMRRYLDDDVTTRVRSHGRPKGLSDRIVTRSGMLTIEELTSRVSSADISDVLGRLEYAFDAELDTGRRRYELPAELARARKEKRDPHQLARHFGDRVTTGRQPVDVALATSMLQVGVDVSRLGLMVVTGQPKNTAEYIQASSRIGRDPRRPGLVVTLYNWTRPRDLAHYEDFEHYHATFYRQVEALSVTPYTRRALDRGTTGTFVAAVRNAAEAHSRNTDAHDVPLGGPVVDRIVRRFLDRAEAVGGTRGRGYLEERLGVVKDRWNQAKTGSARLGYAKGPREKEQVTPLLEPAGESPWGPLTAGQSMRETESEINLLLPGGGEIFTPLYGAPEWSFAPAGDGGGEGTGDGASDGRDDDGAPEGDELGESRLTGGQ